MASVRKLKKDINYLSYELLTEAFAYRHFHPELKEEKFDEIIKELVFKRNELIARANNFDDTREDENVRQHFKAIRSEMADLINVLEKLPDK